MTYKELEKRGLVVPESMRYDAQNKYYDPDGYPTKEIRKQYTEFCTNLITDMVANGATAEELEKAILFSMVCIDSQKYKLSIIKAEEDLDIKLFEEKYMSH